MLLYYIIYIILNISKLKYPLNLRDLFKKYSHILGF